MAANTEETVRKTIGHSRFMPTYGSNRAPQPSRARSGIRRCPVPLLAFAAQGFIPLFDPFAGPRLSALHTGPLIGHSTSRRARTLRRVRRRAAPTPAWEVSARGREMLIQSARTVRLRRLTTTFVAMRSRAAARSSMRAVVVD